MSVNGVRPTAVNLQPKSSRAIIPFTYEMTNFHQIKKGTVVNLEFDILGSIYEDCEANPREKFKKKQLC